MKIKFKKKKKPTYSLTDSRLTSQQIRKFITVLGCD
jgi:hypothetical protein